MAFEELYWHLGTLLKRVSEPVLLEWCFPYDLKTAILKPLLKKLGLDPEHFKNLRPISNIAFLSKLLESLACEQYVDHLKKCNLAEMFQSAYREGHSVETALVRVHNDIMRAFDEKMSVILVLLDLSAAFDTVDHDRLLAVLNSRIGITGAALSWFESYLKYRTQHVAIKNVQSSKTSWNVVYHRAQYWAQCCLPHIFFLSVTFCENLVCNSTVM